MARTEPANTGRGSKGTLSRRRLLAGAAVAPLAVGLAGAARVAEGGPLGTPGHVTSLASAAQPEGRIVRSSNPPIEESPLAALNGLITPTRLHFIRNHAPTPQIDAASWKLGIDGEVDRPFELSYDEIRRLPSVSSNILIECAGNSRSRFSPQAEGTQWTEGAVSVAEWTGVRLGEVLRMAGMRPNAVHVLARGADAAKVERGLPVDFALGPDTLLAWAMNGEALPPDHGFPLRLVFPGWIGVANVKWLEQLTVLPHPLEGPYQTVRYTLEGPDYPERRPATILVVKAVIARPTAGSTIAAGPALISGFAWSGFGKITRVEVSTDGGGTWADARLLEPIERRHWARWDFPWNAPPGQHTLLCRATDETGAVQPRTVTWNRQGYQNNASVPTPVGVGQPAAAAPPPAPAPAPAPPAPAPPPAAAAPTDAGREVFAQECARCHGDAGQGTNDGPQLIGRGSAVPSMSARQLDEYVRSSMPNDKPGSLSPDQYSAVIDYLRKANNLP